MPQSPMTRRRRSQRGIGILICIVLTGLVLAIGAALLSMTVGARADAQRRGRVLDAQAAAEAGMEYALRQLNTNTAWRCTGAPAAFTDAPLTETINGATTTLGTFTVDPIVDLGNGLVQVTVHGYYPSNTAGCETKTIRMTAAIGVSSPYPFNYGIFARDWVNISGGKAPNTDSFDSSQGSYSAATAGYGGTVRVDSTDPAAITVKSGCGVKGDLIWGPGANLSKLTDHSIVMDGDSDPSNDFQVASSKFNPPSVTVPDGTPNISDAVKGMPMVITDTPTPIPAGTYVCDGINVSGGKSLKISGNVVLYVRGNVTFSGSGFGNLTGPSTSLKLYCTPACTTVTISGSADVYAGIYAPDANITKSSGNTTFFGSVVGKTVTLSGGGSIHYDQALSRTTSSSSPTQNLVRAKGWAQL